MRASEKVVAFADNALEFLKGKKLFCVPVNNQIIENISDTSCSS